MAELDVYTPWSSTKPYVSGYPAWVDDELDAERIASYALYDQMYWNHDEAFKLVRRGDEEHPIFIPNPRKVVDTTAYYLMKGLDVDAGGGELEKWWSDFAKREAFFSRWETAKHAGVTRGDFLFHITADPQKPEGTRLSLTTLDPASYFPIYDPDDITKKIGCRLVEQWKDPGDLTATKVKILDYRYEIVGGIRRVARSEAIWRMYGWNNPKRAVKERTLIAKSLLPDSITTIPVYCFTNQKWEGDAFGSSELRGFERLVTGVNQIISDAEVALALEGMGVYATDAGRPVDDGTGEEIDWVVAPGRVLEVPGATMFKRVEGIKSMQPVLELTEYLETALYEGSGTSPVARGDIEVQLAESFVGLSIAFIPTLAKIERRDRDGVDLLTQMLHDLKFWIYVYEGLDFREKDLAPKLGDKLPVNRPKKLEELNNMLDRNVISMAYYRKEVEKLGYKFPSNMEQEILDEIEKFGKAKNPIEPLPGLGDEPVPGPGGRLEGAGDTLPRGNKSNNRKNPNESRGTEIDRGRR